MISILTAADKAATQTGDTELPVADSDVPAVVGLQQIRTGNLHNYASGYPSPKFLPPLLTTFVSVPISADAGATQMKWGNWAKILSSVSVKNVIFAT